MSEIIEAWHFLRSDKKLRFEPHTLVEVGQMLDVDELKLDLCSFGLHGSITPLDALSFVDWKQC